MTLNIHKIFYTPVFEPQTSGSPEWKSQSLS